MGYGLVQTVAPTGEPVTVELLKQHLRLFTDTEDNLLSTYITTARTLLEEWTQRQFMTASYTLYLDEWSRFFRVWGWSMTGMYFPVDYWPFPNWWQHPMYIPKPPLQSVTSITYLDQNDTTQTLSTSEYVVDTTREPARIVLQEWPSLSADKVPKIQVNFTAGYASNAVPAPLCHAIMLLAADFYRQREATSEWTFKRLPLGMQAILDVYRLGILDNYGHEHE